MMRAMILAAGKGERMRPLTEHTPKCLLRIHDTPLIVHHICALAKAGISDIVINLGHLGEQIEAYLGKGHLWGVNIEYSYENPILETGGGIKKALPLLGDNFIVVGGDIFTHFDFKSLCMPKMKTGSLAHLVLTPNPSYHPKGDFGFLEDSAYLSDNVWPLYNFGGIGLYTRTFFERCPEGKYPLVKLFKQALLNTQLTGEFYEGLWYNVGTPQQLQDINHLNNIECNKII